MSVCEMFVCFDLPALIAAGKRRTGRGRKGMRITVHKRLETGVCTVRRLASPEIVDQNNAE